MTVTKAQIALLRHALGYGGKLEPGWRNYFCATVDSDDDTAWRRLVTMGLAEFEDEGGMRRYHATELGKRAAKAGR